MKPEQIILLSQSILKPLPFWIRNSLLKIPQGWNLTVNIIHSNFWFFRQNHRLVVQRVIKLYKESNFPSLLTHKLLFKILKMNLLIT